MGKNYIDIWWRETICFVERYYIRSLKLWNGGDDKMGLFIGSI